MLLFRFVVLPGDSVTHRVYLNDHSVSLEFIMGDERLLCVHELQNNRLVSLNLKKTSINKT